MLFVVAGGDKHGGETGFLGCMRNLYVQGVRLTDISKDSNVGNVVNGSCDLQDRFAVFMVCRFIILVYVISQNCFCPILFVFIYYTQNFRQQWHSVCQLNFIGSGGTTKFGGGDAICAAQTSSP